MRRRSCSRAIRIRRIAPCWKTGATADSFEDLPVRRVERDVLGDLAFPAVAVREQALLVVIELLARLGRELEVRPLDDGIHRARFLAQPAIDAFDHVDVVARGAARAVV